MKRIVWELADAGGLSFLSHEAALGQASYPSVVVEFIVPRLATRRLQDRFGVRGGV
jgi:hypothetical protein